MNEKITKYFIIGTFVTLYLLVSCISTIHVIDFFNLSNPAWLSISLAIAFEVGAAASLASLITLEKMNKAIVWALFMILTAMQAMGNAYYAYIHLNNFQGWIELFGLVDEDLIYQKRVLSIVSGAILPVVALGFIKSLVDYIKPTEQDQEMPESADSDILVESKDAQPIEINLPKSTPGADLESPQATEISIDSQIDKPAMVDGLLSRGGVSVDTKISRGKR